MDTFFAVAVLLTVYLLFRHFRFKRLVAAGQSHGLTISAGPLPDERAQWSTLANIVHTHVPTSWGYSVHGLLDGQPLRMQEQEIRSTLGSNRVWHTLVVVDLKDNILPEFTLRAGGGRPVLRQLLAPIVDPLVRSLGGELAPPDPGAGISSIAVDTEFCNRWLLAGSDPAALERFFDACMRRRLLALDIKGEIGGSGTLLVWFTEASLSPSELNQLLQGAREVRDAIASQ